MARTGSMLINRDYARLWYGQAISSVGNYVFDTTLVLWVATVIARGQPWAPAAVSGVLVTVGVTIMVVGPFAGVFVDRWNRKATMLRTEVIRAALVGVLAALSFLPVHALPTAVWLVLVYAVVFGVNATGQFFVPARFAVVGQVVEGEADRTRASGLGQTTTALAAIIGPPIAAPLLFTVGVQWALLLNALSYVVSYVAIRSVRLDEHEPRPASAAAPNLRAEFVAGVRFFAGNRVLVAILAIGVIAACGTGAINALDVFFITQNLHANAHLFGFMSTAFGVGAIAGSVVSGAVVGRFGARTTTWATLLVTGVLFVVYARQGDFVGGVVFQTAFSIPVAIVNAGLSPILMGATPDEYMGRMIAVFNPVQQGASMLSVVVAGWLASTALRGLDADLGGVHFGAIDSIFVVCGALIVLSGVFAAVVLPRQDSPLAAAVPEPEFEPGV